MTVVITKDAAKAVVLAELNQQISEPKAWAEMHLLCAIEAIRRGDHDIALNHISTLRRGPTLEEAAMKPRRPLHTRERLRRMLESI
jgi:hypothetical protein